jgi:cytidine deaminase
MKKDEFKFSFEVYDSIEELPEQDAWLLRLMRHIPIFM